MKTWCKFGIFILAERTLLNQIFAAGEVSGTTYFRMGGVGGQIHVIFGVLDVKR